MSQMQANNHSYKDSRVSGKKEPVVCQAKWTNGVNVQKRTSSKTENKWPVVKQSIINNSVSGPVECQAIRDQ